MAFPIIAVLGAVVKPIADAVRDWQKRKAAKLESDLRINEARTVSIVKRMETQQEADIAWENLSIEKSGWKDEYWTIVLSIPAILCFIPGMVEYVRAGFAALAECPTWYQWMLAIAVGSAFGFKKIADFMSLKKGG